jgi:hypothetical protein
MFDRKGTAEGVISILAMQSLACPSPAAAMALCIPNSLEVLLVLLHGCKLLLLKHLWEHDQANSGRMLVPSHNTIRPWNINYAERCNGNSHNSVASTPLHVLQCAAELSKEHDAEACNGSKLLCCTPEVRSPPSAPAPALCPPGPPGEAQPQHQN